MIPFKNCRKIEEQFFLISSRNSSFYQIFILWNQCCQIYHKNRDISLKKNEEFIFQNITLSFFSNSTDLATLLKMTAQPFHRFTHACCKTKNAAWQHRASAQTYRSQLAHSNIHWNVQYIVPIPFRIHFFFLTPRLFCSWSVKARNYAFESRTLEKKCNLVWRP